MHSFYDMIDIMERDRSLDEDWKKWAMPVAIAAGSLASAYRAVNYPTKPSSDRPAAVSREVDEAPHKGDVRWQRMTRVLGTGRANEDLARRQSLYNLRKGGGASKSERDQVNGEEDGYPRSSVTSPEADEFF